MALKPEPAAVASPATGGTIGALWRTARPRHWIKNVLVLPAALGARVIGQREVLVRTGIAFVLFCLAASGAYFLNDAADVEADRRHERKRLRPVAAGELSVARSAVLGAVLLAVAIAGGFALVNVELGIVIAA